MSEFNEILQSFREKPAAYFPDGKPILSDDLLSGTEKWAMLFEQCDGQRIVGQTKTLYGEKLSTVWLGLDHNFFSQGPPLIFETMLFAPDPNRVRRRTVMMENEADAAEYERFSAYLKRNFPHDQLQLRYATRREAEDSHHKLKLQCLIPPRWRHFLLWTVARDEDWRFYDDADNE